MKTLNQTSVLQKCGASDDFVKKLLERGFYVPMEIQRHPKPLHPSHAHPLLYELESQIPRFTEEEKRKYIEEPYNFYLDAVRSAELHAWIIGELLNIVPNVLKLEDPEEKVAASLALIRLFFASYDFNILKYDRDIEYHEFEESVTGYFWQKGVALCDSVFPGEGEKKLIKILAGTPFLYDSMYYYLALKAIQEKLKKRNIDFHSKNEWELLKKISSKEKDIWEEICWVAKRFYKYPKDVIHDLFRQIELSLDTLLGQKLEAQKEFFKVFQALLERDVRLAEDFINTVKAIDIIMRTNERIDFIVFGKTPQGNGYVINDSVIKLFEIVKSSLETHPELIRKEKEQKLTETFRKVEEMKSIGLTPGIKYFLTRFENDLFLSQRIYILYMSELKRWQKIRGD
jgi:hypothetical protein